MGEPSKEAWMEAAKLWTLPTVDADIIRGIAAAIQRHMDATAEAQKRVAFEKERAQQASADAVLMQMRAESAEAEVGGLKRKVLALAEERAAYFERTQAAEQHLADLVREVRKWREDKAAGWRQLDEIIAKYEKPAEVAK